MPPPRQPPAPPAGRPSPAPMTRTSCCGIGARVYVSGGPGPPPRGANRGPFRTLTAHMHGQIGRTRRTGGWRSLRGGSTGWSARAQLVELGLGEERDRVAGEEGAIHRCTEVCTPWVIWRSLVTVDFMAAVLACGEGAALSHFSAAVLWEMLRIGLADSRHGAERSGGGWGSWCTMRPLEGERAQARGHRRDHAGAYARRPRRRRPAPLARAGHRRGRVPPARPHRARAQTRTARQGLLASVLAVHTPAAPGPGRSSRSGSSISATSTGSSGRRSMWGLRAMSAISFGASRGWSWRPTVAPRMARPGSRAGPVKDVDLLVAGWRVAVSPGCGC